MWGTGTHLKVSAAVVYVTQCQLVDVTRHDLPNCTQEIPVIYNGSDWFMDPVTRILSRYGQIVPCDPLYPIKWAIGNDWYCSHPAFSSCSAPEKVIPTSYQFEITGLTFKGLSGGLYNRDDWSRHEMAMMYRDNRESLLSEASSQSMLQTWSTGKSSFLLTDGHVQEIIISVSSAIVPFFHWIGYSYMVIIGFVGLFQMSMYLVNSFCRFRRLYRTYGFSWKLLTCVWSLAYHLITTPLWLIKAIERRVKEWDEPDKKEQKANPEEGSLMTVTETRPPILSPL